MNIGQGLPIGGQRGQFLVRSDTARSGLAEWITIAAGSNIDVTKNETTHTLIIALNDDDLTQNTTGSAATLTTPRNINGVAFNGSQNITVTASAETLTGNVLHSTVSVADTQITFTNNSTGNASTSSHGYLPILPGNTTTFLRGDGSFASPSTSAIPSGTFNQSFSAVSSVVVTHNLGSYPNVQVIDNSLVVIAPTTITHNSVNQLTITFSGSTTGTVLLTSGSPPLQQYIIVSANYTVLSTDVYIECTAAGKTITLPDATLAANMNKFFNIDNSSAGNITIATTSSQTIQGNLTQILPTQSNYTLVSNGTNWRIK